MGLVIKDMVQDTAISMLSAGAYTTLVTRLISNSTKPLVGCAAAVVAAAVSALAMHILSHYFQLSDKAAVWIFLAFDMSSSIGFSVAATALGYPISISMAVVVAISTAYATLAGKIICR